MGLKLMTCVVMLSVAVALSAAQNRAVGRVFNRNGVGLSGCQLDFYYGGQGQVTYRVYTDQSGTYFIDGPRNGSYSVTVMVRITRWPAGASSSAAIAAASASLSVWLTSVNTSSN